ncbi:hypothetical protein [Pseudolabrys sp.]|uniref:hypothetical protein n=1 Tax=Pseudolabrys sp. TaxID=1960880 RepID=UPI003D137D09
MIDISKLNFVPYDTDWEYCCVRRNPKTNIYRASPTNNSIPRDRYLIYVGPGEGRWWGNEYGIETGHRLSSLTILEATAILIGLLNGTIEP